MDKKLIGVVAAVVAVGAAIAVWFAMQPPATTQTNTHTETETSQEGSESGGETKPTAEVDKVAIKDFAFSPATIKVKKGTTVTWTNEDSVGHNVVADGAATEGGLPASNALLSKGETYSFTFDTVGTFKYMCAPHSASMKGTVEVVE